MSTMRKICQVTYATIAIIIFAVIIMPRNQTNDKSTNTATTPVELTPEQKIHNYKRYLQLVTNYTARANVINDIGVEYNAENNYSQAFKYYLQSAKMGNAYAEANLAGYYLHGYGTLENVIQAYAWEAVAVANGFDTADDQSNAESTRDDMFSDLKNVSIVAQAEGEDLSNKYYQLYGRNKSIE